MLRQELAQQAELRAGPTREETGDDAIICNITASGMTSNPPLQWNRGMADAIGADGAALGRNVPGSPGILCVLGPFFCLKTMS